MKIKKEKFIFSMSIILIMVILISAVGSIAIVKAKMTEYCFDELKHTSQSLAADFYTQMKNDRLLLTGMGSVIASMNEPTDDEILQTMESYDMEGSYISYIVIMTPDNRILRQDGTSKDVTGIYDFNEEASKGFYSSEKVQNQFDKDDYVVRNAVPVVKDGKTIAMIYGVISLTELAKVYNTDIYDGNANLYIVDGTTGDFLLDTWHKTLGNVSDFTNRQPKNGYSFETAIEEMKNGQSGNICFKSTISKQMVYMHYEPIGINNWNVLVSVDEKSAFKQAYIICNILYLMAAVIGLSLVIYMILIVRILIHAYKEMHRIGTNDQTTELLNRNAYDVYVENNKNKKYEMITCIYVDANGLHEINNQYGHAAGDMFLRSIADALKKQFKHHKIYRIGGDEFVVLEDELDEITCREKMETVIRQLQDGGYEIAVGFANYENKCDLERLIQDADKQMLENKSIYYKNHKRKKITEST